MKYVKNFVFIIIFLLFSLTVLTVVRAQTPEPSPTTASSASYVASKPTILPDHPVYKLRLLGIKLKLLFTSPAEKTLKYIELADQELAGALAVIENGNTAVGIHSAFRGEHYITLLVREVKTTTYRTGVLNPEPIQHAHNAFPYHQSLLTQMMAKTSGEDQNAIRQILEFSERNDNELQLLEREYSTPDTVK